jgi:hypothetical protein
LEPDQQRLLDALTAEIGALFASESLDDVDLSADCLSDDEDVKLLWGQLQASIRRASVTEW